MYFLDIKDIKKKNGRVHIWQTKFATNTERKVHYFF